jgi:hypothetical protein
LGRKKADPKKEGKKMEKNVTYTECELKHIRDEGLDPWRASEICAKGEESRTDEKSEKSSEDQRWDFYGD